jgi:hypothetical protein
MSDIQLDSLLATVSPSFSIRDGEPDFPTQGAFMVGVLFICFIFMQVLTEST